MIEVNNLTKQYGNYSAINGLSLKFDSCEQYAVLGASGSGKSTLLYLLGGLDRPTSGDILVDQRSLLTMSDKELALFRNKEVGFVFQFHFLLPSITCLDNILLPARIGGKKVGDVQEQAIKLGEQLHVSHCMSKYPFELSGGEQQRVNIIRALSMRPKVLLCDEPTGSLDSENSQRVAGLLQELAGEFGATLIVVTHDDQVAKHFNKQYHLQDGKLC